MINTSVTPFRKQTPHKIETDEDNIDLEKKTSASIEFEKRLAASMRSYFHKDFINEKEDDEVINLFCFNENSTKQPTTPKKSMPPPLEEDKNPQESRPSIFSKNFDAAQTKPRRMSLDDDSTFLTSQESMRHLRSRKSIVDLDECIDEPEQNLNTKSPKRSLLRHDSMLNLKARGSKRDLLKPNSQHNLLSSETKVNSESGDLKSIPTQRKSIYFASKPSPVKTKCFISKLFRKLDRRFCAAVFKNDSEIVCHFIEHHIVDINYVHQIDSAFLKDPSSLASSPLNFLPNPFGAATSLSFAVAKGRYEMTELLIKNGALLEVTGVLDNNPLHIAAYCGDIKIMKLLLTKADINFKNNDGDTAVMVAAKREKWEIVCELLNHKANTNIQNKSRETVLQIASQKLDKHSFILTLLSPMQARLFFTIPKTEKKVIHEPLKHLFKTISKKRPAYFYDFLFTPLQLIFGGVIFPIILIKKCLFDSPSDNNEHYTIRRGDLYLEMFRKTGTFSETHSAIIKNDLSCLESCIKYDSDNIYKFNHCGSSHLIKIIITTYNSFILILKKNVSNKLKLNYLANDNDIKKYYFNKNYRTLYNEIKKQRQEFMDMIHSSTPAPLLAVEDDILS